MLLIFGISGAMRSGEFCPLTVNGVEDTGSRLIVTIRDTKNYCPRSFVIESENYERVKQYTNLRPTDPGTNRFFLRIQGGKCSREVIGTNQITEAPKTIASFLNLSEPNLYTGHCFRRTSAALFADSGAVVSDLKRHGGWRSDQVALGYMEDSIENKSRIFQKINKFVEKSSTFSSDIAEPPSDKDFSMLMGSDDEDIFDQIELDLPVINVSPAPLEPVTTNNKQKHE